MFQKLSKKNIILIILAAMMVGLLAFFNLFVLKPNLSAPFQELNNVNLSFSFEDLNLFALSWNNLIPDDLANINGAPEITVSTGLLPDSDFDIKIPLIDLRPPSISADDNIVKTVSAQCRPFQKIFSCAKIYNLQDKATCEQCQKEKNNAK